MKIALKETPLGAFRINGPQLSKFIRRHSFLRFDSFRQQGRRSIGGIATAVTGISGGWRIEFGSGIIGIDVRGKEIVVLRWWWILELERRSVEVEGIHFEVEIIGDSEMYLRLRSTVEREGRHRCGYRSGLNPVVFFFFSLSLARLFSSF